MAATDIKAPRLLTLLRRMALTGFGALQNRGELFLVELQEERVRVIELAIWMGVVCAMAFMFMIVLTATIIFLFSPENRVYAAGTFAFLYLLGTVLAFLNLRAHVKNAALPFSETIEEVKKDRTWLDSLK